MFTAPGDEASALAEKITAVIQHRSANAPRSKQRAIGLSEIGEACVRKISYKLLDWPKTNTNSDPWPSISGTAIHSWLAEAFDDQYDGEENKLYLVEHAVMINDELGGTVDLFDIQAGMVIDHKCVGATSMRSRKQQFLADSRLSRNNVHSARG